MKFAWVKTNLLDLWAEPAFNTERLSQLLFCDIVEAGKIKNGYCRVVQEDGYTGWSDIRQLEFISARKALEFRKKSNFRVVAKDSRFSKMDESLPPHFLFYGTCLYVKDKTPEFALLEMPSGQKFHVKPSRLSPIIKKNQKITARMILTEARRFLGVPYLWGGITTAGFDCSGFVRTIFDRFGIYLSRDTKEQIKVGEKVERDGIISGDLLFFERHVALAIDKNRIIHASIGGGGVRENSLRVGLPDYREDLDRSYKTARRVACLS